MILSEEHADIQQILNCTTLALQILPKQLLTFSSVSMIEIVPYNPAWPKQFEIEQTQLVDLLSDQCIAIHHVGSTAVKGLCAKPKLDIIAVVNDLDRSITLLENGKYQFGGELNIPFRYYFKKRGCNPEVNLHVYEEGHPEISLNLTFRDYLRSHPEMISRYASLKQDLVSQNEKHQKENARFSGYNLGKDSLIKEILNKAGFDLLCMRICTHYAEREAIEQIKGSTLSDSTYLAFYKGTAIVGYAELKIYTTHPTKLLSFNAIEEGEYFQNRCNQWMERLNRNSVHNLESTLNKEGVDPKLARSMAKLEIFLEKTGKMPSGPKNVRLFHKKGTKTDFTLD